MQSMFLFSSYEQKLEHIIADQIQDQHHLLIAYSGGLDSTVLLDLLTKVKLAWNSHGISLSIRAVHIHHGLNQQADNWLLHAEKQCKQRYIPFSFVRVSMEDVKSIEATARTQRYLALQLALRPNEVLLTAHHQDDQAETLLLALKRGSGPSGLAAMKSDSYFHGHRLIRPLLTVSRKNIEKYALDNKLFWIEDDSNNKDRFDRNFIRLHILPLIHKRWPYFSKNIARSSQLCGEQEDLLDEFLASTLTRVVLSNGELYIAPLLSMSAAKRRAVLRRWLAIRNIRMPSKKKLEILWQEVVCSKPDANPYLQLDGYLVRRYRNKLYLISLEFQKTIKDMVCLQWPDSSSKLCLNYGLGELIRKNININNLHEQTVVSPCTVSCKIDQLLSAREKKMTPSDININSNFFEKFNLENLLPMIPSRTPVLDNYGSLSVIVRPPLPHEQISVRFGNVTTPPILIVGRCHARPLKKIWQELGVPPWLRTNVPLLFYNDDLIAAPGMFVTNNGQPVKYLEQHLICWLPNISKK